MMDYERARGGSSSLGSSTAAFAAIAATLTVFGVLMIYSASSIVALTSEGTGFNSAYYAIRQMGFAGAGALAIVVLWHLDYHVLIEKLLMPIWALTLLLLLVVAFSPAGEETYGAIRWIRVGPLTIQPSEFAKATLLLVGAHLIERLYDDDWVPSRDMVLQAVFLLGAPLLLVLKQPDKGTVLVIGLTLLVMLFLAGADIRIILGILAIGMVAMYCLAMSSEYSRTRVLIMRDPWSDEFDKGYQLVQGYYAFGSGGLTGVGLGMSRQKYSYLPMAYTDFIFAVIGEELGFVGAVILLAAFCLLAYMGYRIASEALDLSGQLIAAGSVSMFILQLLVNVCGVLGIIPLSGKPIPFISYGGSSIVTTLIMVGLVLSVSRAAMGESTARRAGDLSVFEGSTSRRLRVIPGGASDSYRQQRLPREYRAAAGDRIGVRNPRRIDLGPSATDRLRRR